MKSKRLLMLKSFVCMLWPVTAEEDENLPQMPCSFTLLLITFYFFHFTSPGIGFKNRLLHLMPAKAREAKEVSFKFKG